MIPLDSMNTFNIPTSAVPWPGKSCISSQLKAGEPRRAQGGLDVLTLTYRGQTRRTLA